MADNKNKKEKEKAPTPVKTLLKEAKASIKSKNGQGNHEKKLNDALKREDLTQKEKTDIYHIQSLLNISMNDGENMKAYLKQNYDTVAYFRTLLAACNYAVLCDSVDNLPNQKGVVKPAYQGKNRDLLVKYRPNLYEGGRFHLRKNDYKSALPYFMTYIDLADNALLSNVAAIQGDMLMSQASLYATVSAHNIGQYATALKYVNRALDGTAASNKPTLHECKTSCLLAVGDTANWLKELKIGCRSYPTHNFFFSKLIEYFENNRQYDEGIALSDTMLQYVQDIPLYWYAKSLMYLHKEKWEDCIAMCDSTLKRDSMYVDAIYNQGVSYLNLAMEEAERSNYDPKNKKSAKDRERIHFYYRKARPPFEKIRRMQPKNKERWGKGLYRIYLNLNMGREFEEIEQALK